MKHLKKFNEEIGDPRRFRLEQPNDDSLNDLVKQILDAVKLDPDEIINSDPEIISHIGNMIKMWCDLNR